MDFQLEATAALEATSQLLLQLDRPELNHRQRKLQLQLPKQLQQLQTNQLKLFQLQQQLLQLILSAKFQSNRALIPQERI